MQLMVFDFRCSLHALAAADTFVDNFSRCCVGDGSGSAVEFWGQCGSDNPAKVTISMHADDRCDRIRHTALA